MRLATKNKIVYDHVTVSHEMKEKAQDCTVKGPFNNHVDQMRGSKKILFLSILRV